MSERDVHAHYELGLERGRLSPTSDPRLEYVRTTELLERLLPPAPTATSTWAAGPERTPCRSPAQATECGWSTSSRCM
jgi:hypothetical protein